MPLTQSQRAALQQAAFGLAQAQEFERLEAEVMAKRQRKTQAARGQLNDMLHSLPFDDAPPACFGCDFYVINWDPQDETYAPTLVEPPQLRHFCDAHEDLLESHEPA